jgi:hypothetical protein
MAIAPSPKREGPPIVHEEPAEDGESPPAPPPPWGPPLPAPDAHLHVSGYAATRSSAPPGSSEGRSRNGGPLGVFGAVAI